MKRKVSRTTEKKVDKSVEELDSSDDAVDKEAVENVKNSDSGSESDQKAATDSKKKKGKGKRGRKSAGKKNAKRGGSEDDEDFDQSDAEENGDIHESKTKKGGKGDDSEKKKKDKRKSSGKKSKKDKEDDLEDDLENSEPDQKKSKKGTKDDDDVEEEDDDDIEYEVEKVLNERTIKGSHQYLIRWKGYESDGDTWEQESTLNCKDLIKEFHESQNGSDNSKTTKKTKSKKLKKKSAITEQEVDWSSDDEFEVDRILEVHFKRNGKREFLVSWKGYPSSQDSWEPEENLDCADLITKFMDKVNAARVVDSKDLRIKRTQTERFTLQMDARARRLSRRIGSKQRVHYHDAE